MAWWKATKKFFGRFSLRRSNRIAPSCEEKPIPDPDQADILEWEKEMKAKPKKGVWGLKRRKVSKSKIGKKSQIEGNVDAGINDGQGKLSPSISLSNVERDETNEDKLSSVVVVEDDEECERTEKSYTDEDFSDGESDEEKEDPYQSQVPAVPSNPPPNENFWDNLAEDYLYGEDSEEDEGTAEDLGGLSYCCDDYEEEYKSVDVDSDLPEKNTRQAAAFIDMWVGKTVTWGSSTCSDSESQSDDMSSDSFHMTEVGELNDTEGEDFLSSLDMCHLMDPKRQDSIIAKTEDWTEYFTTVDGDSRKGDLTSEVSGDSGLETDNSDKEGSVAKISKQKKVMVQGADLISQALDQELPSVLDQYLSNPTQLAEENLDLSAKSRKVKEKKTRVGFVRKCFCWISRRMGPNKARVAPAELIETQVMPVPCPIDKVKVEVPRSPSPSKDQIPSSICQPDMAKGQIHDSSPRLVKLAKAKKSRKSFNLNIVGPMPSNACQPEKIKSTASCQLGKVEATKASSLCKSDKIKVKPLDDSSSGKVKSPKPLFRNDAGKKSLIKSSHSQNHPEPALRQKPTSQCDSLFGEVTLRRRKEKAGSQCWIRFPGGNQ